MKPLPKKLEDDLENAKFYRGKLLSSNETENLEDINTNRRRSIPSALAAAFDDSVERAMYDEILGPMLKPRGRLPAGSGYEATKLSSKPTPAGSASNDFTTTLLQRLQKLEAETKEQRIQLAEKITTNQRLEEELNNLKMSISAPGKLLQDVEYLTAENQMLQKKCLEMEQFLADYGLVWVGSESSQTNPYDEESNIHDDNDHENDAITEDQHRVSFAEFVKYINALNEIIFSEPTQIITDNKKARLAHASELVERIKITYYANGLMIKRGPFRACSSQSYRTFMKDVVDGYFPSEFREIYPDGVTFDVVDKHDILYQQHVTNNNTEPTMSTEQFLDKVPKTIVRNGELIDMRQELRLKLNYNAEETSKSAKVTINNTNSSGLKDAAIQLEQPGPKNSVACVHQLVDLRTRVSETLLDMNHYSHSLGRVVHIHIKGIPQVTLRGSFYEQDTVEDIKEAVQSYYEQHFSFLETVYKFEFRTAFPSKLLFGGMTLHEAGLVPTGTVYVKVIQ